MKIPIYRYQVDFVTQRSEFNPQLLFAQKYMFAPNEQCPLRICYANAIVLIESGAGELELNNQHYTVGPGTLVYIAAGHTHQWTSKTAEPMVQRCVYFDWTYVNRPHFQYQRDYFDKLEGLREDLLASSPELKLRELVQTSNIAMWVSYYNALTPPPEVLGNRKAWDFLKYNGAFQTFLHHFLSYALKHETIVDPRVQKILASIDSSPFQLSENKLYEWAKELGLGKSRFHDLFKKDTGCTPSAYLQRLKFQLIAEDLCFSNLTITEIAHKYNFSSIHYFSKAFHKATGLSPTRYKEKHRFQV